MRLKKQTSAIQERLETQTDSLMQEMGIFQTRASTPPSTDKQPQVTAQSTDKQPQVTAQSTDKQPRVTAQSTTKVRTEGQAQMNRVHTTTAPSKNLWMLTSGYMCMGKDGFDSNIYMGETQAHSPAHAQARIRKMTD